MRRSIDDNFDDHPPDDEDRPQASWVVGLSDDCDACGDIRVLLTLEEVGAPGTGVIAHLSVDNTRRLRQALADALKEVGEEPGR